MDLERDLSLPRRTRNEILLNVCRSYLYLISSIYYSLCEVYQFLRKHRKRTLSTCFLFLEAISFVLDAVGKHKWVFLLAAFLLSLLGLVSTVCAHVNGKTFAQAILLAQTRLIAVEIGFSVLQLIGTFIYFVRGVLHVKIGFNESIFPLFFSATVWLYSLVSKDDEDSSHHDNRLPALGAVELASASFLSNVLPPNDYEVNDYDVNLWTVEVNDSSLGDSRAIEHGIEGVTDAFCQPVSHSPTRSASITARSAEQLQNMEVNDSSPHEQHISSLEDSPTLKDATQTMMEAIHGPMTLLLTGPLSDMARTSDQMQSIEMNDSTYHKHLMLPLEDFHTMKDVFETMMDGLEPMRRLHTRSASCMAAISVRLHTIKVEDSSPHEHCISLSKDSSMIEDGIHEPVMAPTNDKVNYNNQLMRGKGNGSSHHEYRVSTSGDCIVGDDVKKTIANATYAPLSHSGMDSAYHKALADHEVSYDNQLPKVEANGSSHLERDISTSGDLLTVEDVKEAMTNAPYEPMSHTGMASVSRMAPYG